MPIASIQLQPSANKLMAAYRPIFLKVSATATGGASTPPVVYCDIYFNGRYYKTLSKTVFSEYLGSSTSWQFDLQDACQEFLEKALAPNGVFAVFSATSILVKVFCRFRSSGIDGNGFVQHEGTAPVQATLLTQPVPGTGTQSNTFYVLNATLQHQDNQDLELHANAFKKRTWKTDTFPLAHRPDRVKIGLNQSDYFPVALPSTRCQTTLRLRYKYLGQTVYQAASANISSPCTAAITNLLGFQDLENNITITWDATGNFIGFEYQLDGAPAVEITDQSISFFGMADGAHVFTVRPLCDCGAGAVQTLNFTF